MENSLPQRTVSAARPREARLHPRVPKRAQQLGSGAADRDSTGFPVSPIPAANVASVPQRSPLRYPGGKTWLIPHIRAWLSRRPRPQVLFDPFCGGGVVSLTAVMENLADKCVLVELDRDVAAFWHAALRHTDELCDRVLAFEATRANVLDLTDESPNNVLDQGFRALVLNRTRRGGILAAGASLARVGENGKGVASRWYPDTIVGRLRQIGLHSSRIAFCEGDGMKLFESMLLVEQMAVFVDPPYTAGGKRAGRRLYDNHEVDHRRIFEMLSDSSADFLMTYDAAPEIVELVRRHGFIAVRVTMKNTHHARLAELVITRTAVFGGEPDQRSLGLE